MREKWLEIIGKNDLPPGKRTTVCSLHFTEDCFRYGLVYGMRRIKEDAIPSLYLQETEEESEMLNQLHRSSVNETLEEVINNCHTENSEASGVDGNSARVLYRRRRRLKNIDSNRYIYMYKIYLKIFMHPNLKFYINWINSYFNFFTMQTKGIRTS